MGQRVRKHPVLGRLEWDEPVKSWVATVDLMPHCSIRFAIAVEADWASVDPSRLFDIGAEFLAWARTAEPRVRERVADDLLNVYNDSWADSDPDEGTPPMNRAEFLDSIRPSALGLSYDGTSRWDYACGDLFAGHGIWLMLDPKHEFIGKASLIG
jgi:hypothetical protein